MKLMNILFLFFLFLIGTGCNNSNNSNHFSLNIIHMNDIHSHLDEEQLNLTFDGQILRVDAGGYPRIATKIRTLKKNTQNTLLLNAGDALQGTLYYTLFKGEVDAKMMNALGWDAFVLGNHEFDDGDANLKNFLDMLDVPVITANLYATQEDQLFGEWNPYIIYNLNGEDIGIIGIDTVIDTKESSNPGEYIEFFNEIETTQKYVDELTAKGVNKIILLSHFGYENDLKLSAQIIGIDVIVGGHSHTLMGSFNTLGLDSNISYPQRRSSLNGENICIVQAGAFAKVLGNLHVIFDKYGRVTQCDGTPILSISDNFTIRNTQWKYEDINSSLRTKVLSIIDSRDDIEIVKKDLELQNILDNYKSKVDEKKKEIIGVANETIVHVRIPNDTQALGSDVSPVVCKAFYERVNNSDAVILNAGAVRHNIEHGDISVETAYTLLPFSNTLVNLSMKGKEIYQVLEDALSNYYDKGGSTGSFPYAYALKYDIDMQEPQGSRVQNLEILDKNSMNYVNVEDETSYNITTISYLALGKDGYTTFGTIKSEDTYFDYANSFVNYVKALSVEGKTLKKLPPQEHCIKSYINP